MITNQTTVKEIQVFFQPRGNTVIGNYSLYSKLDRAMADKAVFLPEGYYVRCDESDFRRSNAKS